MVGYGANFIISVLYKPGFSKCMKSVHSVCCNKVETFARTVVLQAKKKLKRQNNNNNNKLLESAITIDALTALL